MSENYEICPQPSCDDQCALGSSEQVGGDPGKSMGQAQDQPQCWGLFSSSHRVKPVLCPSPSVLSLPVLQVTVGYLPVAGPTVGGIHSQAAPLPAPACATVGAEA